MEMPRRFVVEPPRRVLVVGNSGSGREAIAGLIATKFSLPCVDLVSVRETTASPDAWRSSVTQRVEQADWSIFAGDSETLDITAKRAEWLIWLDLPISACVGTFVRQALAIKRRDKTLPTSASRKSLWGQIRQVLHYPVETTPRIIATIERERRNRTIFILRSKREVRDFVDKLPKV
jgi:adenylate kinase family enzyme